MKKQAILFSGALILLIIGIALVIYLFSRSSKTDETEETGGLPTVKDAGIELVLNPGDAVNKVEEYSIFTREYAIGDTTAKNIDVKLKWTNGPTFASVGSLIFVHKANGNKVREDVETIDNIDSNATNELIFKGADLTSEDIVGDNTIDMYWNKIDDNTNKLTTISFKIEQKHLDTTLNLDNATPIEIPVQLSSTSKASGTVTATHTKYRILPFFEEAVHIRKTSANDKGFHIIKGDQKQIIDSVDTFYIVKALGKEFISKDVSGNNILRGDTKKFVSKDDIFSDITIMNSSSIILNSISACSFVLPESDNPHVKVWFSSYITEDERSNFKKRCEGKSDACTSTDKFFKESDFVVTQTDCTSKCYGKSALAKAICKVNCTSNNTAKQAVANNAKNGIINKQYKNACKSPDN